MRTLDKFFSPWHGGPTLAADAATCVHESRPGYPFRFTERHLQCAWFDSSIRPSLLETARGEPVIVEDPGRWNLEEGPDFVGASLLVGPGDQKHRICGDVEVHISPIDWRHHHHTSDPLYASVVAHVAYFEGALPAGVLPSGAVEISLQPGLSVVPGFSFEAIDTAAYPYAVRDKTTPCGRALAGCESSRVLRLLEATGAERIRRKAERMADSIERMGENQTLYAEIMCALGYKKNRLQFRRLAHAVPFARIHAGTGCDSLRARALLTGAAGLLPGSVPLRWDTSAAEYVRSLWNQWWKHGEHDGKQCICASDWSLARLRPQNHPRRRIAAAASLFCRDPTLASVVRASSGLGPTEWYEDIISILTSPSDPFWDNRLSFETAPSRGRIALIGSARATSIVTNVIIPFALAAGALSGDGTELLRIVSPDQGNALTRHTAAALLGGSGSADIVNTALGQQGLMQVFHDFCAKDRSSCHNCPLPAHIRDILD